MHLGDCGFLDLLEPLNQRILLLSHLVLDLLELNDVSPSSRIALLLDFCSADGLIDELLVNLEGLLASLESGVLEGCILLLLVLDDLVERLADLKLRLHVLPLLHGEGVRLDDVLAFADYGAKLEGELVINALITNDFVTDGRAALDDTFCLIAVNVKKDGIVGRVVSVGLLVVVEHRSRLAVGAGD